MNKTYMREKKKNKKNKKNYGLIFRVSQIFIERTDAEAPILWPLDAKS